jgi:molybdenum cofactor sulfurtransferase
MTDSSACSSAHATTARQAVLDFFGASSEEYTVIFTSNASAALKLVGEAFPFAPDGTYVLAEDSHNSVHGIRRFAATAGASVHYIPSTATGGFDDRTARVRTASLASLPTLTNLAGTAVCAHPRNGRVAVRADRPFQYIKL